MEPFEPKLGQLTARLAELASTEREVLECLSEKPVRAWRKSELSDRLGCSMRTASRRLSTLSNDPVPLLSSKGSTVARVYWIKTKVRLVLRALEHPEESLSRRVLLRFAGNTFDFDKSWELISRPNWFWDIDVVAQPMFTADEDLLVHRVSRAFFREFSLKESDLPLTLQAFLTSHQCRRYDPTLNQDLDDEFFPFFLGEIAKSGFLNNTYVRLNVNQQPRIYQMFASVQERHPGVQGTLVRASENVRRMYSFARKEVEAFRDIVHDLRSGLAATEMSADGLREELENMPGGCSMVAEEAQRVAQMANRTLLSLKAWEDMANSRRNALSVGAELGADLTVALEAALSLSRLTDDRVIMRTAIEPSYRLHLADLDELALVTIIESLLRNAMQVNPTDGEQVKVILTISKDPSESQGGLAVLEIRDFGGGVEMEISEMVSRGDIDGLASLPSSNDNGRQARGLSRAVELCRKGDVAISLRRHAEIGSLARLEAFGQLSIMGEN